MTTSYAQSQSRLQRFLDRDHAEIGELGRTRLLSHGERTRDVAVLFHGMSASPTQFGEVARLLYERGYNVLVPRLPRHGYSDRLTEVLAELSAAELKDMATEAAEIAHGLGERVTIVGFSLGGLLAAWVAQFHRVEKVVCVAPFFGVAWMPHAFAPLAAWGLMRMPNRFHWWHPIKREKQMPAHGYPRYSTHAVAQAYQLVHDVFNDAHAHAPRAKKIVMITNAREMTVSNRSARKLVKYWRQATSADVTTYEFTGLPPSHDIIEPLRHPEIVARVYPVLLDLIAG